MKEPFKTIIQALADNGWLMRQKKFQQELRKSQTETRREELNLSVQYIDEFKHNIYEPLKEEVRRLRTAIEAINTCKHRLQCPIVDKLHEKHCPPSPGV
ncbi:MAG: hypothetical protein MJZ67_00210 [Bacteroidales bacterium]|nr:hypothetical protein [Bacteroidales bacterium]